MSDKSYNGWSNYETWLMNLWMDNEESDNKYWCDEARNAPNPHKLAEDMKEQISEVSLEGLSGFRYDMMRSALLEVDWDEIARHWYDENNRNSEEEVL